MMLKKLALNFSVAIITFTGAIGMVFAQVEVNKADQASLESVKGIGPSTSTKILEARKKEGPFKNWPDLATRVKGIGDKTAVKFSDGGLTVNGQSLPNGGVVPAFAAKDKEAGFKQGHGKESAGPVVTKSAATSATATGLASQAASTSPPAPAKGAAHTAPSSAPLFPSTPSSSSRPAAPVPAR